MCGRVNHVVHQVTSPFHVTTQITQGGGKTGNGDHGKQQIAAETEIES